MKKSFFGFTLLLSSRARLTKVEFAKEAEAKVEKWLQEIKLSKEAQ